ncbi:HpcH/HpaI aldolase family protein [Cupriavidus basilensis]|uniref:HpcH/HpaI aldolase family protein n=1 Tax=Cupriavidus basilensis TaxID=68895 RepID=UPI00157A9E3D|nr:HpcH/HpaI aldolase/citrate lyase family protein [Cupriavidus basilensis]NUA31890.1 2-dehydro-3-deoxyglucarate aldolase [Cupriavidus basilensis]
MQLPVNAFKQAILADQPQIGLWCSLSSYQVVELVARSQFDWLLLDMEHAPNDISTLHTQLMATEGTKSHPVVRPPWNDMLWIKRCLDIGAQSLLLPYVQNAEEAANAVAWSRFPKGGMRGVASGTRAGGFGRIKDFLHNVQEQTCVLVQLESMEAIRNVDAICALDGVDGVFIGPSDLSADMNHLGDIQHPEVQETIAAAIRRIRANGKAAGILTTEAQGQQYIDMGARFVAVGTDMTLLRLATDALAARFKQAQ